MTRVLFFDIPQTNDGNGEILAVFTDGRDLQQKCKGLYTCYAHIGQHSECHIDYIKNKQLASPTAYADLLKELIGQGYDDLKVMNADDLEYHRKPTDEEIKFGHGATHYKTFRRWEIQKGLTPPSWLKDNTDTLRYYYH